MTPFDPARRGVLKTGLFGGAILTTAGLGASLTGCGGQQPPADGLQFLTADDVTLFVAIAPTILKGAIPDDPAQWEAQLTELIKRIDFACTTLSTALRDQVRELLDLLNWRVSRYLTTGISKPWADTTDADVQHFLERWRTSSVTLFNGGYRVLTKTVESFYYTLPTSWQYCRYPGPPAWAVAALSA